MVTPNNITLFIYSWRNINKTKVLLYFGSSCLNEKPERKKKMNSKQKGEELHLSNLNNEAQQIHYLGSWSLERNWQLDQHTGSKCGRKQHNLKLNQETNRNPEPGVIQIKNWIPLEIEGRLLDLKIIQRQSSATVYILKFLAWKVPLLRFEVIKAEIKASVDEETLQLISI